MRSLGNWRTVLGAAIVPAAMLFAATPAFAIKVGAHYGQEGPASADSCASSVSAGYAHCLAHFRTDAWARDRQPAAHGQRVSSATLGNNGAYDPSFLQSAYATPSLSGGVGQTVAIVDAYDDPNAESDMAHYRSYFGLPACTTANGCFRKVNQSGAASPLPAHNSGWGQEISLDLDMISAICTNCHIVLVEANTNAMSNLGASVNTAVKLGANVVTNSYGGSEYSGETSDAASYFTHPGVAITAASGDNGYGVEFPAAAPTVTAVGGTSLYQETNTGTRNATEEAWSGAGSGCSAYEPQQAWQLAVVTEYTLTGCYKRIVADVSADANPSTGVWVYDTYGGNSGFEIFGGTSASTQIIGAVYALAGNAPGGGESTTYPYSHTAALNYVHAGSNGKCGTYLCNAADSEHFNGPTGLGTPNGIAAFTGAPPAPPTSVPGAPSGLTAKAGNGQVALSWTAPSSTGGAANITYELFRGTSPGGESAAPIATGVTGTSFTDKGLSNGTAYYYTVKAVNSLGAGAASGEASATPASAPGAPLNLTASTAAGTGVALKWSAPTSNGGSVVTSYVLYRATQSGRESAYATVNCTASTCSVADTGTRSRTVYYYTVAAVNAIGTGPQSNQASAKAK